MKTTYNFDEYYCKNGRYTVLIDELYTTEEYTTNNLYAAYKYYNMLKEAKHNALIWDSEIKKELTK